MPKDKNRLPEPGQPVLPHPTLLNPPNPTIPTAALKANPPLIPILNHLLPPQTPIPKSNLTSLIDIKFTPDKEFFVESNKGVLVEG
jgi:hypothetical protein